MITSRMRNVRRVCEYVISAKNIGEKNAHRCFSNDALYFEGCFAGIQGLDDPKSWTNIASNAVAECQSLVDRIVTSPPSADTVQGLDDMSDVLCQVLDAAEFCRNVHVDENWREEAEKVCIELGSYVHELNTNYALYTALTRALATNPWWENDPEMKETALVGSMLQRDFERFGVHLEGKQRDRMTSLVSETQLLGFQFMQNTQDPTKCGRLKLVGDLAKAVNTLPIGTRRAFRPLKDNKSRTFDPQSKDLGKFHGLEAPGIASTLTTIICRSDKEAFREAAWRLYNNEPRDNIEIVDKLMASRLEIAQMMGFKSYGDYQLSNFSLAGTQLAVNTFLDKMSAAVKNAADIDAAKLKEALRKEEIKSLLGASTSSQNETSKLEPWNRHYAGMIAGQGTSVEHSQAISQWLTLDSCIAGASALIRIVMGIILRESNPLNGELWAPGVKKFIAEHSERGVLGVVYLDLLARPNKFPGAAHFTLRCGRRLRNGEFQKPVVAVVASFNPKAGNYFSLPDLETLMHELGHALHSLLSRTQFQHLSGTRGPHDIVEIPSHVFERFAWDPAALKILASGSNSNLANVHDKGPPFDLLQEAAKAKSHCAGLNLQSTIQMCMMDQLLHGENPPSGRDAGKKINEILRNHGSLGEGGSEIYPHLRFGHLIGYGSGYYTYLFAQCISAALWRKTNNVDHLLGEEAFLESIGRNGLKSPSSTDTYLNKGVPWPNGQILLQKLLAPGGAVNAREYVEGILNVSTNSNQESLLVDLPDGDGCYPDFKHLLESFGIET